MTHDLLCGAVALLAIGRTGEGLAQQLPPAPDPIPLLKRGPDGRIEVVPAAPAPAAPASSPPAAAAKPAEKVAQPSPLAPVRPPMQVPEPRPATAASPSPTPSPRRIAAEPATIDLPEPLAIELPPDKASLAPDSPEIRDLLSQARSGERTLTTDLSHPVEVGPTPITWTAWEGSPATNKPAAVARAFLIVLPAGLTPVGLSGDENATAGNNATKIARNAKGDLLHMVWLDDGRPGKGSAVMYRRAAAALDGTIHWETAPVQVDTNSADWNGFPGLAVSDDVVHVVWQSHGVVMYRRLDRDGAWGTIRDLGVPSDGRDVGPSISARNDTVHIATPGGVDILSSDGGATWRSDPIPLPPGRTTKTVSVAVDATGGAHFALSAVVHGPENASSMAPSRGYWELRYARRAPDGTWTRSENILEGRPEWAEASGVDDVLADWTRLLVDDKNNLHVTWHGTAISRIYGNDRAYYAYGPSAHDGHQQTWEAPTLLIPTDTGGGIKFSFAPSLALGANAAVPLVFYDVYDGTRWGGFDVLARLVRTGGLVGMPLPISQWVRQSINLHRPDLALSARFPAAAPTLFRAPDGHIWLDVLETLIPMGLPDAPKLIAYQRIDVTQWLDGSPRPIETSADRPALPTVMKVTERATEPGTVLFTLRDVLSYVPSLIGRVWR